MPLCLADRSGTTETVPVEAEEVGRSRNRWGIVLPVGLHFGLIVAGMMFVLGVPLTFYATPPWLIYLLGMVVAATVGCIRTGRSR
jgi:hypothetical protein